MTEQTPREKLEEAIARFQLELAKRNIGSRLLCVSMESIPAYWPLPKGGGMMENDVWEDAREYLTHSPSFDECPMEAREIISNLLRWKEAHDKQPVVVLSAVTGKMEIAAISAKATQGTYRKEVK